MLTRLIKTTIPALLCVGLSSSCAISELEPLESDDMSAPFEGSDMTTGADQSTFAPNTGNSDPNNMTTPLEDMFTFVEEDMAVDMEGSQPVDMSIPRCTSDAQCMFGSYCELSSMTCVTDCMGNEDCPEGGVCDVSKGRCMGGTPTTMCGDGACEAGEDCGTCPADCGCEGNKECQNGLCVCDGACTPNTTDCQGNAERLCLTDADGCGYWGTPMTCPSGICSNGSCCQPRCGARECGTDGCGGTCGTCTFSCGMGGICTRQIIVVEVRTSCDADCQDTFDPTDPYTKLIINGQEFEKDRNERDRCDETLTTQNWTVGGTRTFSITELTDVTVEVSDADSFNSDDLCAKWEGVDLTMPGMKTLTSPDGKVTVKLSVND